MIAKSQTFEQLLEERESLLEEHRVQLLELDNQIRAAARAKGFAWAPIRQGGAKVSPGHSNAKLLHHERNREICREKGWMRPDGTEDLERLRLEQKSAKLGISVLELTQKEAKERATRAAAKFKGVVVKKR